MRYQSSQSYHTLKHWQSGKRKETGPYTSYISGTTSFFLEGFVDTAGDLVLFPFTLIEDGAVAGGTLYSQTRSRWPFTAYYIAPLLTMVFAGKWTTADGYDVYYRIDKAGENVHTTPGTIPNTNAAETVSYSVLTYENGQLKDLDHMHHSFEWGPEYVGKVALPIVNRYKVHWNYYQAGTTDIAEWCKTCTDMGTTDQSLGVTPSKWNYGTITALSKLCAKLYHYDWFDEVPRLTGLTPIRTAATYRYLRFPTVRGGFNASDTDVDMYVAGAATTAEYPSDGPIVPYVATSPGIRTAGGYMSITAYSCERYGNTIEQDYSANCCCLCGDMGTPWQNGDMFYNSYQTNYNSNLLPYGYAGAAESGISTIVRRIHDIEVQDNFKFFT